MIGSADPRHLTDAEARAERAITEAIGLIRRARDVVWRAPVLPDKHPARESIDGFLLDIEWIVDAYLDPANAAIDAEPAAELERAIIREKDTP